MIVDLTLAPLAVLAFLGTAVCTVALTVSIIVTRSSGKKQLSAMLLKILAGGLGLYFVVMLGVSAFSKDYDLRFGAEKHFCEMDCHIAYAVMKVEQPASLQAGFSPSADSAPGRLYIVTLRTRFDETTIGPNRGNAPLTPNGRKIYIRDDAGHEYSPTYSFTGTPLDTALRPGESYETKIMFRLPESAKNPRMFLSDDPWPSAFLIGHERSPLHGKAYFDLIGG